MKPLNTGPNATFDKSVPVVWLFYSIIEKLEPNGPSEVDEWIKKNSKNIEEETCKMVAIGKITVRSPKR